MNEDAGCAIFGILVLVIVGAAVAFAAGRGTTRANGRYEERCEARGGFWLPDSVTLRTGQTRCIAYPTPIMLRDTGTVAP